MLFHPSMNSLLDACKCPTRDRTHNLSTSGGCSNQRSYLARAGHVITWTRGIFTFPQHNHRLVFTLQMGHQFLFKAKHPVRIRRARPEPLPRGHSTGCHQGLPE